MSIENNSTIIVERTANGYQVRSNNDLVCLKDVYVFQDKGYASASRDNQNSFDTLLGWIDQHFSDSKK